MSDLAIISTANGGFDIALGATGLQSDEGLSTAVALSLHLDARAEGGAGMANGWWADIATADAQPVGSKLWTLKRSKATPAVMREAQQFAYEALQWLLDNKVARSIKVTPHKIRLGSSTEVLALHIEITRADGSLYAAQWQAHQH